MSGHGAGRGVRALTVTLPLPWPLLTINARRRMHWGEQARHARAQRQAAWVAGLVARAAWERDHPAERDGPFPPLLIFPAGPVRLDVAVRPRRGQRRCDDTALWEALKPTLDGFADAGLVGDDAQFRVGSLAWLAERAGELCVTLTAE